MVTNIIQMLHTTAAYQSAAFQLMVGGANFAAKHLDLKESLPITVTQDTNTWYISPPPWGVGGTVATSNYFFIFQRGQLTRIEKKDWLKQISPPVTDETELADQPSLLDTNGAYKLATKWLTNISVDVSRLEQTYQPRIFQASARRRDADGNVLQGVSNKVAIPLFMIGWGDNMDKFHGTNNLSRPSPSRSPSPMSSVFVKILGTTKELLELSIQDTSFFTQPPLIVTNAAELLGPLPPPRHFVEDLIGGKQAYATVVAPDKVEAWLLNNYEEQHHHGMPPERTEPKILRAGIAKALSNTLLDFDSYAWSSMKLCSPDYGLRLRFERGDDSVEILFCYECDILQITHEGQTKQENFDFAHNKLVKAVQSAFPRDEVVRKLEANDEKQSRKEYEGMLKTQ